MGLKKKVKKILLFGGVKMKKLYVGFIVLLFVCSLVMAVPVKIVDPHTRYNPWMGECVYFFTFGQCYVDPDHCSTEYGVDKMTDRMIELDREKECIYSREEYHKYLEEKKENVKEEVKKEEVKINTDPIKFVVEETEYVSLLPKGHDPDEDEVVYEFTSPLDEEGGWQTDYGDAGEYETVVTASDGELSSSRDVSIVVEKKEEAPTIISFSPDDDSIEVGEGNEVSFSVVVEDKNNDDLEYSWKFDDAEVSNEDGYSYDIGYDQAGDHIIEVLISDGTTTTIREWKINVINVNREPILSELEDVEVKETETVVLEPSASDEDNEEIKFELSGKFSEVDGRFEWKTTYDDSGEYTITVTAMDGEDSVSQEVKVTVVNVNRPPVIEEILSEIVKG